MTIGALILTATSALGSSEQSANPYIPVVEHLYQNLEYEDALREVAKARAWGANSPAELSWLALFEGILLLELEQQSKAEAALRQGLQFDPAAQLPTRASPKLRELFERIRTEMAAAAAQPSANIVPVHSPAPQMAMEGSRVFVSWVVSAAGFSDLPNASWGVALAAGLAYGQMQAQARFIGGARHGVGLELSTRWPTGRLQLKIGARGAWIPRASAVGAGPLVGASFELVGPMRLFADCSVEYLAAPWLIRPWSALFSLGLELRGAPVGPASL